MKLLVRILSIPLFFVASGTLARNVSNGWILLAITCVDDNLARR